DRGHQLRAQLPRGFRRRDRPEGPRRAARAAGVGPGEGARALSTSGGISQLADRGGGRCVLSGALTLESAPWLWKELETGGLLGTAVEADLSGVDAADSAGLALLVAWKAYCRHQGNDLVFKGVPARLRALAALTGAGPVLG